MTLAVPSAIDLGQGDCPATFSRLANVAKTCKFLSRLQSVLIRSVNCVTPYNAHQITERGRTSKASYGIVKAHMVATLGISTKPGKAVLPLPCHAKPLNQMTLAFGEGKVAKLCTLSHINANMILDDMHGCG